MFDQLTWSLGMFAQSACALFVVGYLLRNSALAKAWTTESVFAQTENWIYKIALPAAVLFAIYALELTFLHWIYGGQDSTALDWAVVVLLLGGLVVNPVAAITATVPALVARASFAFSYSADPTTKAIFESHGRWLLESSFWIDEQWVWGDPGVLLLLTSALLAIVFHIIKRQRNARDYPLWIGVPAALISQAIYVLAANSQWDHSSAQTYLRNEAVPAAISLVIVTTALVVLLRALNANRDKHRMHMAELAAAQHQLKFLNAQINPHFLNNSLNAVSAVSVTHPERTHEMLDNLALHFRAQCDVSSSLTRFEDEWKLVHCYLDIEKIRMGERLNVQEHIDPACLDISLPRLVIQPLIENAIQHGIQAQNENGILKLNVYLQENRMIVTVEDNGPGQMKTLTPTEFGTGLTNINTRLNHFYNDTASLKIESQWGKGTKAILNIPSTIEAVA